MKTLFLCSLLLLFSGCRVLEDDASKKNIPNPHNFTQDVHYVMLDETSQLPSEDTSKVLLVEFFKYSNSSCKELHPLVHKLMQKFPKQIELQKYPLGEEEIKTLHSQMFFIKEEVETEDDLDSLLFDLTSEHKNGYSLDEQVESYRALFEQYDVSPEEFDEILLSQEMDFLINDSKSVANDLGIDGIPALIVGKYKVKMASLSNIREVAALLDYLIQVSQTE